MTPPEYPGHALTVALTIMKAFPNLQAAREKTDLHWAAALGHEDVQGARDGVLSALQFLERVMRDRTQMEAHIQWSHLEWRSRVGPGSGHPEQTLEKGLHEAKTLEGPFHEAFRLWMQDCLQIEGGETRIRQI